MPKVEETIVSYIDDKNESILTPINESIQAPIKI